MMPTNISAGRPAGILRLLALMVAVLPWGTAIASAAPPDTDALRAKYPEYRAALAALGDEQTDQAITRLSKLVAAEDPELAADASFFLGRAYVIEERFEEAAPLFARLTGPAAGKTTHAAESLYFRGLCEARLLRRNDAIATLARFLDQYKDAPERMRVDAWRQWAELRRIKEESIEDIQQHMDYARRRLSLEDAGKKTRTDQEEIVAMLTKLIGKEDEDDDSSGQSSEGSSGRGGKMQGGQGSKSGSGGGGTSPGGNRQASGDEVVRRLQNPGSRSQFGRLRDRQRAEQIYGALKTRFPARYKELVEQYYKNLQEDQE
jgi:tetratricopeptide (TPR) repeat protein